jgi:molecular chaperone GrpE
MRENSEDQREQRERGGGSQEDLPTDAAGEKAVVEDAAVLKDRWLRTAAELQNLRKRTAREIEMETRRERETLLGEFIRIVDNLERALGFERSEHNPWYEGMVAIHGQMLDLLKHNGVVPFVVEGEQFDPNRHEAAGSVEMPGLATGTIVNVLERGYEGEDGTLVRPAKVIVAKTPAG